MMKMICPHCGVKGSANDSLIGTKVKCPKCLGIFVVESEVVQPIAVDDVELEQLQDAPNDNLGVATDEEVDDVINELLGDSGETGEEVLEDDEEIDKLLLGDTDEEDEVVAALSDMGAENLVDTSELEDVDETLTIIEDFPEEALSDEPITPFGDDEFETVLQEDAQEIDESLNEQQQTDEPSIIAGDDLDPAVSEEDETAAPLDEIEIDDPFSMEDEPAAEAQETAKQEDETGSAQIDEIEIDDAFDISEEKAEESEISTETVEEEEYLDLDEATAAEEIELEDDEEQVTDSLIDPTTTENEAAEIVEDEDEVVIDESHIIQKCAACDEYVDPDLKYEHESRVYCSKCLPPGAVRIEEPPPIEAEEIEDDTGESEPLSATVEDDKAEYDTDQLAEEVLEEVEVGEEPDDQLDKETETEQPEADDKDMLAAAATLQSQSRDADLAAETPGKFTISTLIKDAYHYSKGAKGSIWAAIIVMTLILGGLWGAGAFILFNYYSQGNAATAGIVEFGMQFIFNVFSFIFYAGILMIAVRRVAQEPFSWTMLFSGFKRFGALLVLYILMSIMLVIGFILLILPGIYLTVGYTLAVPLLLEKRLSPWQALEQSRMAIHKRWWTVFFAMIVLTILTALSAIPLGIGLIWTIPMFTVLIAVLYYHSFGAEE